MKNNQYFIIYLVLSLLIPTSIFAWASATHVYFANHLGKSGDFLNFQEMYGAMAPDMYKTIFILPYFDYLKSQTHEAFQKVVDHARIKGLKAFAYGFASHNEVWGADYTAHHNGRTTPGIGYVTVQIETLTSAVEDSIEQVLLDNHFDPAQAKELAAQFAPSIAHIAAEIAVDILIKRNEDPGIGKRILQSAQLRSPAVSALLVAAYATDLAREFGLNILTATGIIVSAEETHRKFVNFYGYIFTRKEAETIQLLSVYSADLAELYMKVVNGLDITVPPKAVADLLALAITQVESSYAAEVAATLEYLKTELPSHGIESQSQPVAGQDDEPELGNSIALVSQELTLAQNQPNPFNPTTTINYSLAQDGPIKITVYNTIGQSVAVLVDGIQSKGCHSVTWNAQHQAGGLYIYRLEADGCTASKKMFLQK